MLAAPALFVSLAPTSNPLSSFHPFKLPSSKRDGRGAARRRGKGKNQKR